MHRETEFVKYGSHGICRILGTEILRIDKRNIEYFVLEPLEQTGAKFYIPVYSKTLASKIHPIISPEELQGLLNGKLPPPQPWIEDNYTRRLYYLDLLASGDRGALLGMLQTIYTKRPLLKKSGKRLHSFDENFIRSAWNLLSEEFSIVLGIPRDEIGTYIQNALFAK